jgi:hypothetical protein
MASKWTGATQATDDFPAVPEQLLTRPVPARLPADKQLVIIPRATHLGEEPGALQEVAWRAVQWFARYLCPQPAPSS